MSGNQTALANLPLDDPNCINVSCIAFKNARDESQALYSYYYQYEYGHWTTYCKGDPSLCLLQIESH